ncbi:MAG: cell division protein ZipA C-terminal FtsZ-binding domain-containing protein [Burkholderiales bacterium]
MSDLQIGLAILGALIVVAVLAFNYWQERQFQRRGEQAFTVPHEDVLLDRASAPDAKSSAPAPSADDIRIEPRMEPELEVAATEPLPKAQAQDEADVPRREIDYIAELRAGEFIATPHIAKVRHRVSALGRRVSFGGLNHETKSWEPVRTGGRYTTLRVGLQLVDRSGPAKEEQFRTFCEFVKTTAAELTAIAEMPEFAPSLEQATALDEFCADVDVLVGINVIANTGQVFHGTKIRGLAEARGLRLQSSGVFHCHDEQGSTLFSLDNQQSEPFLIDRIRNITTPGVTFLLDVPRVANGLQVFDKMVAMSRTFAESLDGILADDNRALLNDAGLDRIRAQLRAIYSAMEQRGIDAGSPLALRLFS